MACPAGNACRYRRLRTDRYCHQKARLGRAAAVGLAISDAIRLLMLRIADEQRLPFEVTVPNAATRRAMAELEQGKGKRSTPPRRCSRIWPSEGARCGPPRAIPARRENVPRSAART